MPRLQFSCEGKDRVRGQANSRSETMKQDQRSCTVDVFDDWKWLIFFNVISSNKMQTEHMLFKVHPNLFNLLNRN